MLTKQDFDTRANLRASDTTRPADVKPLPLPEWPDWAKAFRAQATSDERNLTETIERLVGPFGSDAFKLWHSEQFGALTPHCNCAALKWQWATQFDYSKPLTNPTD